jgi:hypothetical protein
VLRIYQICERQKLRTSLLVMLIGLTVCAMPTKHAFADLSPEFSNTTASAEVSPPIQLAEANIPPGVGSLNDYMSQSGDGPSPSAVPPPRYSSQPIPPQNYYPQSVPSQEWNNQYVDPNTQRSALIGAAVVGALAVGLWAWQQHELQQSRPSVAARRRHNRRPALR